MAETTLLNDKPETENLYGITPEMRKAAREKLERLIREQDIKLAKTAEELYAHSIKDDDGEEIEEFMQMRRQWREEDRKLRRELD